MSVAFRSWSIDKLLGLVVAINLIGLHTPDGIMVYLNADKVVSFREPRKIDTMVQEGVKCLVHLSDGKWIGVAEDCTMVRAVVSAAQNDD